MKDERNLRAYVVAIIGLRRILCLKVDGAKEDYEDDTGFFYACGNRCGANDDAVSPGMAQFIS